MHRSLRLRHASRSDGSTVGAADCRSPRRARTAALGTLLALLLGCSIAQAQPGAGYRMDPAERQRLRAELREQAVEQRMRMRQSPPPGGPTFHPAGAGFAPGYGPPVAYPPPGRHGWSGPPPGAAHDPAGGRLTFEERQQLRRQLRDARQAAR